jgi:hypothetical protein
MDWWVYRQRQTQRRKREWYDCVRRRGSPCMMAQSTM